MRTSPFYTRREFLRGSVLGGALSWTVPGFVQATLSSLQAAAAERANAPTGKADPILGVLQLAGGNDGLNTVVPTGNDFYYKARPTLAIGRSAALRLDDHTGLHPALAPLKQLYDDGLLAVVQGVGYPNPNRSHFRSTEIWQTACDAGRVEKLGWIGRYFDHQCAGDDATAGIAISSEEPQSFTAAKPKGVAFQTPETYRVLGQDAADGTADEALFHQMNGGDGSEGGSIGSLAGARRTGESPLDFLERVALDAQVSSDRILQIARKTAVRPAFPANKLGRDLELVARLIAGGMATRVYYVSHGGFDTHNNQASNHERLLRELGEAVAAFVRDLKAQGSLGRVQLMTFSEFGRRVAENGSKGTDHGTAAPLFIAGGRVKPGLHGTAPDLDPAKLDKGDLRFTTDFRSVYATVLERHLGAAPAEILGRAFPLLPFA